MIDKETWNVERDCDKMEKMIKNKMSVQHHKKRLLLKKKTFSSNIKQSTVFFYNSFLNTMNQHT